MSDASTIIVLMPEEGESWNVFVRRIGETKEDALVVLTGREDELVEQPELRGVLLKECKKHEKRVKIATKLPSLAAEAREMELTVLDRTKDVRTALKGHPKLEEVLRVFSPHLWRQQLASQLQHIGLLSVPRLRIYVLSALSAGLFFFVFFRLLPSAEVRILPRQEPVSQTMNVYLVQSGATSGLSPRVRTMPLLPIAVSMRRSATYDHISKEFIGNSSMISLTISNTAAEQYSFRTGTRFTNQAGMVFRIQESAVIPAGKQVTVRAKADDTDLYGQIIGDRGNVPAGLKWEIPGLSPAERKKIYAENKEPAKGGTTAHRTVLKKEDIDLARKKLEIELTNSAKQQLAEVVQERAANGEGELQILEYAELTKVAFSGFVLPTQFIGQEVKTIPMEGSVLYTMYAYDAGRILDVLKKELLSHVRDDKRLLPESLQRSRMDVRVIDYDNEFLWIKLTVDLVGTEEYILDPLSAMGALFGKRVRERVAGLPKEEALRIVKNMPEVDDVEISIWPPWSGTVPPIPSHISIVPYR